MIQYQLFETARLDELWGDFMVYRDLEPADPRLPGWRELRRALELAGPWPPRKAEPAYGRVVAAILQQARRRDRPRGRIRQLLYVGDTRMNDGTAFANLCAAGGWPGWCFIGRDAPGEPARADLQPPFCTANRWASLAGFADTLQRLGVEFVEETAVVIDMDKTAVGARGRNDAVIDRVRTDAVRSTAAGLLGPGFDPAAFDAAYRELNQPAWHPFTADNQDFLAYVCLLAGAGLARLEDLQAEARAGRLGTFAEFLARADALSAGLARAGLAGLHHRFRTRVRRGDPTPFTEFRRAEYRATAACFGGGGGSATGHPAKIAGKGQPPVRIPTNGPWMDETPAEVLLASRIVITEEVRAFARRARRQGALVFGLSDKPPESAAPSPTQAAGGGQSLHRLATVSVGEAGGS
jgi:hypothetical protein